MKNTYPHASMLQKIMRNKNTNLKSFLCVALLTAMVSISITTTAQNIEKPVQVTGVLIKSIPSLKDYKPDLSLIVKRKEVVSMDDKLEEAEEKMTHRDRHTLPVADPVVQRQIARVPLQRSTTISPGTNTQNPVGPTSSMLNFDGMGYSNVFPADPTMCVGPNHIIQTINGSAGSYFKIWNRNGAVLLNQNYLDLLSASGYTGKGDPVALYDQFSDRFILTEFGETGTVTSYINTLIVAVSQTNDPTGGWNVYRFEDDAFFVDYPHWGVWPDAIYATSNDFNSAASAYLGSSVYAFNKAKMIAGNPTAEMQKIRLLNNDGKWFALAPVSISGPTPPVSGTPGMFMYFNDDNWTPGTDGDVDSIGILSLQPDFVTPANTTLTTLQSMVAAPFKSKVCNGSRNCIPGPGGKYDALSDRIMNRVHYRKFPGFESMVLSFTVDVNYPSLPTKAGIRWYELRRTGGAGPWSIFQESTFSPDGDSRWMGSIDINSKGQIALGYNLASATKSASIYFTGRQAADPLNTFTSGENQVHAGNLYGTFSNRWGDYNDMSTDIGNDSLFWMTAMYGNTNITWNTRVTSFKLNGCASPLIVNNPADVTVCAGATVLISGSATVGSPTFQWEVSTDGANTFTAINNSGVYSNVTTGSLTITGASADLNNNYYRLTATNACATTTSTPAQLKVISLPVISPAVATICAGTIQPLSITYGGAPGPVGGTGTWTPTTDLYTNPAATIPYAGTALNTVYAKPLSPTTYTFTPGAGACSNLTSTITVNVNQAPTISAPTVTQPLCTAPTTGTIVVNATGSGVMEYNLNGGTFQLSNTFAGLLPGDYTIGARLQSSTGCVAGYNGNPVIITPPNSSVTTLSFTGPAVPIPDGNPTGVGIPLTFNGPGVVSDVNFRFDAPATGCDNTIGNTNTSVDHTYIGDLTFKLTSPSGTTVVLVNRPGGVDNSGNNFCTILLDDDAAYPSQSTITGTAGALSGNYASFGALSAFIGQAAAGTWTLTAIDNAAQDLGNVRGFSIIITSAIPCPCVAPTVNAPTITQPTCALPTGTIAVNATGSGALEYSINNGGTWQSGSTFSGLAAGPYNVQVRLHAQPACVASLATNPVNVVAAPLPSATIPNVFAVNPGGSPFTIYKTYGPQSLGLTVNASGGAGGFGYSWSGASIVGSTSGSTVTVAPTAVGNYPYTVVISDAAGCTISRTVTVAVKNVSCGGNKISLCLGATSVCLGPGWVPSYLANGYTLGTCGSSPGSPAVDKPAFVVNVSPNPSNTDFRIQVIAGTDELITVRILDAVGKLLSVHENVVKGEVLSVCRDLQAGTYFADIVQGMNKKMVKLIKL